MEPKKYCRNCGDETPYIAEGSNVKCKICNHCAYIDRKHCKNCDEVTDFELQINHYECLQCGYAGYFDTSEALWKYWFEWFSSGQDWDFYDHVENTPGLEPGDFYFMRARRLQLELTELRSRAAVYKNKLEKYETAIEVFRSIFK